MKKEIMIYLYISLNLFVISCHKCGADLLKITPYKTKIDENKLKRKLDNSYLKPIKIVIDYKYINEQNVLDTQKMKRLENIFNEVINSFQSIISVQHYAITEDYSSYFKNNCGIPSFEESSKTVFQNNDL